ncbi:hypothetical protein RSJ42_14975 [Methanosarcina hadiensis]|uniref:hypothetical protein n=1 Tax=Methanosarcina hadiensis TaxID=3078083 RepID=UPI0039776BAE
MDERNFENESSLVADCLESDLRELYGTISGTILEFIWELDSVTFWKDGGHIV